MKDILIDFVLPTLLIMICFVLILCGQNGEMKSILAVSAGWLFKSGYSKKSSKPEITKP